MQYQLIATALGSLYLIYGLYLAVFRLYFSPVAKFPGRKLAALTFWYEFYYDVVLRGQYTKEIARMHEEYGPIIRINPYELHINDPDFYDTVYCLGKRVHKWDWTMKLFPVALSSLGTVDHDLHHARRAPLSPFFSKRAVSELEPCIRKYLDKLMMRFEDLRVSKKAINLFHVYASLTADIISDYSFGHSQGFLEDPNFAPDWHEWFVGGNELTALFKQIGNGESLFKKMPDWLVLKINPTMLQFVKLKRRLRIQLTAVKEQTESGTKGVDRTIFHEIFDSDLPPIEKTVERLIDEGQTVISAGTITTADTLAVISYHLLSKPLIRRRLEDELSKSSQSLHDLEQLPYLTAVIKEGIRIAYGVCQRLPRIFPDDALVFNKWVIPPGTPVSMSCMLIHDNPTIFPNPRTFDPDRWLNQKPDGPRLDRYLVSFCKGTRQCLGINLAYAEMYMTLATLFSPSNLSFELFETTDRDVEVVADIFIPGYRKDSKGIRVTVQ